MVSRSPERDAAMNNSPPPLDPQGESVMGGGARRFDERCLAPSQEKTPLSPLVKVRPGQKSVKGGARFGTASAHEGADP